MNATLAKKSAIVSSKTSRSTGRSSNDQLMSLGRTLMKTKSLVQLTKIRQIVQLVYLALVENPKLVVSTNHSQMQEIPKYRPSVGSRWTRKMLGGNLVPNKDMNTTWRILRLCIPSMTTRFPSWLSRSSKSNNKLLCWSLSSKRQTRMCRSSFCIAVKGRSIWRKNVNYEHSKRTFTGRRRNRRSLRLSGTKNSREASH